MAGVVGRLVIEAALGGRAIRRAGNVSKPQQTSSAALRRHHAEGLALHAAQPALVLAQPKDNGKARGRKPRRVGHNLLLRLSIRKGDVLRFLSDLTVPFTNNVADRPPA